MDCFTHFFQRIEIQRVGHGEIKLVADQSYRHHLILLCNIGRHYLCKFCRYVDLVQIDELDAELHLKSLDHLEFGNKAFFLKDRSHSLA